MNQAFREDLTWWRGLDLNQRPSGYEPDELPDCSTPRWSVNATTPTRPTGRRGLFPAYPVVVVADGTDVVDADPAGTVVVGAAPLSCAASLTSDWAAAISVW
jgi:hypothetical protein